MIWILAAFAVVFLDTISNIIDSFLSNNKIKNPISLLLYIKVAGLLFLPFLFLYEIPERIPVEKYFLFFIIGLLEALYLILYLKSLKEIDTSIVTSLFSLGKIFVPFLAFLIVGEQLSIKQYLGFFVVVFCSTLLTLDRDEGVFVLNRSLGYMALASFLHSLSGVAFKYALVDIDWITGAVYLHLSTLTGVLILLAFQKQDLSGLCCQFYENSKVIFVRSFLNISSCALGALAFSLGAITLIKSIYATQSFVVLIISMLIYKVTSISLNEKFDFRSLLKKSVLFLVMIIAIASIVF